MKLVSSRKTSPGRKRTQSPEKERQKAGGPSAAALEAGAMDPDQLKEMLRAAIAEFVKMFNVRAPPASLAWNALLWLTHLCAPVSRAHSVGQTPSPSRYALPPASSPSTRPLC